MSKTPTVFAVVVGLLTAGASLDAHAKGDLPAYKSRQERTLVGKKTAVSPVPEGWILGRGGLKAPVPAAWHTGDGEVVGDGAVRLRLTRWKAADFSLVVRGQLDADGRPTRGYRVRLHQQWLHVEVLEEGGARLLAPPQKLRDRRNAKSGLEMVVNLLGSRIVVRAFSRKSGKLLMTVAAVDTSYPSGRLGLEVHQVHDPGWGVSLLTVRDACVPQRVRRQRPSSPIWTTLTLDDYLRKNLGENELVEEVEDAPGQAVVALSAARLEELFCKGGAIESINADGPGQYSDWAYRRYRHKAPRRVNGRFPIDRSFKNPEMVEALLQRWAELYPKTARLELIGTSVEGRPIYALVIARGLDKRPVRPAMLLNGAHHGNEPLSVDVVLDAIQELLVGSHSDLSVKRWLDALEIWCVPLVNPDGLHARFEVSRMAGRKNRRPNIENEALDAIRGVDLNRNYPFYWGRLGEKGSHSVTTSPYHRGTDPASEPETQAMVKLANRKHFVGSISYHTGTVAILAPYTIRGVKDPRPNEARVVAEEMAETLERNPHDRDWKVKRELYAVDGTEQDWLRHTFGTLALLVEAAPYSTSNREKRRKVLEVVRATWEFLFERFVRGPAVAGVVLDASGRPVRAQVSIVEQTLNAGERWLTHCPSGRYARYLHRPGKFTLEVQVPGHPVHRTTVRVRRRLKELDIQLPFEVTDGLCPAGP